MYGTFNRVYRVYSGSILDFCHRLARKEMSVPLLRSNCSKYIFCPNNANEGVIVLED